MSFTRILKNTTGSDIEINDVGQTIPASSQLEIYPPDFFLWYGSADGGDLDAYITSGDIVVNDGTSDLSATDGRQYLYFTWSEAIQYDNSDTELDADNVKESLDELANRTFEDAAEFDYWEEESESSTTSNGWVTKLSETTESLSGGEYLVSWSWETNISSKNRVVGARISIDGTEYGESITGQTQTNNYEESSGFKKLTLAAGTHTILIEYGYTVNGGTGRIRRVRASIMKVGD